MEFQKDDSSVFWNDSLFYFFKELDKEYAYSLSIKNRKKYLEEKLSGIYKENEKLLEEKLQAYFTSTQNIMFYYTKNTPDFPPGVSLHKCLPSY